MRNSNAVVIDVPAQRSAAQRSAAQRSAAQRIKLDIQDIVHQVQQKH